MVAELSAVEVMERAEVEIPTQSEVSTQLEVTSAQEERVEGQQLGSPSVLMSTPQVTEPSPTMRLLSGKALVTEASFVQVPSSSFEEHVDYSGDKLYFGDEPAPPDNSKFSHISEEEMQVDILETSLPLEGTATVEGISSIPPFLFFI